jgi:hexosaminidase
MMRSTFGAIALLGSVVLPASAQDQPALMPVPAEANYGPGKLRLDSTFTANAPAFADDRLRAGAGRALTRIEHVIGQPLSKAFATDARLLILVAGPGERVQTPEEDETYTLEVSASSVEIRAATTVGALRGLETLVQLVSGDEQGFYLPTGRIVDRPRFRWRGLLVDVGRHFMPPQVIKRTLDGMALVKLNVLHWHLSDDQGFRVESRRYPKLHQLGSDGLYYTQDQVRDIIAYARDRGIRVVPEFDMPGHSTSWLVGYPEFGSAPGPYEIERRFGVFDAALDPTRDATYQFIDGVIAEMAALFPDPYWHVGGDEVSPNHWNRNPRILRFKREHGFKDNEALQAYFNQRLSRILAKHGKRMVGWDEILHDALPRSTVIQSWRGTEYLGTAASQGFSGILSAPYYLDHIDPADQHYLADPVPRESGLTPDQAARVLGGEACMWAEHINPETIDSRIWPRLAAIAERFWSPASVRDVDDMYRRLSSISIQLERVGLWHEAHTFRMLRILTGRRGVQPLHDLLYVTMPVTFGQRGRIQGTTQLTPLTRLVDAARPDPWVRSQMNRLAAEVVRDPSGAAAARQQLRRMFAGWKPLAADIVALGDTLPLARDGIPAAQALAQLGAIGTDGLNYLESGSPPAGWKDSTRTALEGLAKPQGLLRLAGVEAVRALVDAVP